MKDIFFSIIIPLYNKEKSILDTVNSVLQQTYTNFELVIVNDGSTDKSADIITSFTDSRIKVIDKSNGGVSSARNLGLKNSIGKWVLFLDADDRLSIDALEVFAQLILSYNKCKVVVSNYWCENTNKTVAKSYGKRERVIKNTMKSLWLREYYSRPGNTAIHKSVFEKTGGYDEQLSYNEDYEFSLRLLSYHSIVYTPKKLMCYNLVDNEESKKRHPIDQDFSSYIDFLSFNSIYIKLLLYCVVYYNGYIYNKDTKKGDYYICLAHKVFKKYFRLVYFYYAIRRKFLLLFKSKTVLKEL